MSNEKLNVVWMWLESLSWEFGLGMMSILIFYCVLSFAFLLIAYWLEDRKEKKEGEERK